MKTKHYFSWICLMETFSLNSCRRMCYTQVGVQKWTMPAFLDYNKIAIVAIFWNRNFGIDLWHQVLSSFGREANIHLWQSRTFEIICCKFWEIGWVFREASGTLKFHDPPKHQTPLFPFCTFSALQLLSAILVLCCWFWCQSSWSLIFGRISLFNFHFKPLSTRERDMKKRNNFSPPFVSFGSSRAANALISLRFLS